MLAIGSSSAYIINAIFPIVIGTLERFLTIPFDFQPLCSTKPLEYLQPTLYTQTQLTPLKVPRAPPLVVVILPIKLPFSIAVNENEEL